MLMRLLLMALVAVAAAGCGVSPKSAVCWTSLEGEKVIYLEQSDRIPKDALVEAIRAGMGTNTPGVRLRVVPPELIAEVAKELLNVAPEFSKVYANERMNEAMIGRRILIRGYGTNELDQVVEVIRALEGCFEKWSD
jgi:hypothetical protein